MPHNKGPLLTVKIAPPKGPSPRMLAAGGKTAYDSWVREAGYAKDARILPYEWLKVDMHAQWEKLAADVFKAMMEAMI
jgi:hypothetical protein